MIQHIFFTLLFSLCSVSLCARDLYAFVGADTLSTIKDSCEQDSARITKALTAIAGLTNLNLQLTVQAGKQLTPNALGQWLEKIKPGSDDVIYFHFSGHGHRATHKETRWPSMFFFSKKAHVSLKKVIKKIKKKGARLSIIFCDCCNNIPEMRKLTPKNPIVIPDFDVSKEIVGLSKLFCQTKGTIIASASAPGGLAWSTSKGGIFTNAYLYFLQIEILKDRPKWKHIFKEASALCESLQKPQVEISVKPT